MLCEGELVLGGGRGEGEMKGGGGGRNERGRKMGKIKMIRKKRKGRAYT